MMSDNEIRLLGFRSQHSVWWGGGEWGLSQHSVYEGGEYGGVWKFTGVWGPSFLCWWDYMGVRGALLCGGGGGSIWGCVTIY